MSRSRCWGQVDVAQLHPAPGPTRTRSSSVPSTCHSTLSQLYSNRLSIQCSPSRALSGFGLFA